MANEKNLIPEAHKLTLEEQSAGGRASGEARAAKRDLRRALEALLEKDYTDKESFELLERQKKAFDRYFEKQWAQTKKRIRREAFSTKKKEDEENDEPIEKEGESE